MLRGILPFLLVGLFLLGCSTRLTPLANASRQYQQTKDFASLEIIYSKLNKGMSREKVEHLLGKPEYSPLEGQYYYSSVQSIYSEDQERDVAMGIVVNYRDSNGFVTEILQDFWTGPIGE